MAESSVPGAVGEPRTDHSLRQEVRRLVTNAYYDSRNKGDTMETAADRAADGVMEGVVRPLIRERDAIGEDEQAAWGAVGEREEPLDVADVIAALGSWSGTLDVGGQRAEFVDHVHRALVARLSVNEGGPVARTEAEEGA